MVWRMEDPQGNEASKVKYDIVPFFGNSNLDLGCGPAKVWGNFIGIDNGADKELFGIDMQPDIVVGTCERLPMFADRQMDCVFSSHLLEHIVDYKAALAEWWRLVKVGGHLILYLPHRDLYPNIGQRGANPDHKHDFCEQDIIDAMPRAGGWDLVVNEKRDLLQEYSFLQVWRKTDDGMCRESWRDPLPEKRIGIVRPGALGDAMWGGALAEHFKRDGWHVTVYTGPQGKEILKADPHVDRIVTMPNGLLSDEEMLIYFLWEQRKYTRWANLIGVVEGRLLPHPNEIQYFWPDEVRHAHFNRNYHEVIFEMAGVREFALNQRFYPDATELAWAQKTRREMFNGPVVALAPTGSGGPKTWPHVQRFMDLLAELGIYTVVLGEIRQDIAPKEPYQVVLGKELKIRHAMALAQQCDMVVGEESAIVNAVASLAIPKVVLMSHSSAQNLTRHWKNVTALEPSAVSCHPCHRLHRGFEFCPQDKTTKWSACQSALTAEMVARVVLEKLGFPAAKAAA